MEETTTAIEQEGKVYTKTVEDPFLTPAQKNFIVQQEISAHRTNINKIRNDLGKKCSYLSYTRYKDQYGIKAVINGEEVEVYLEGSPRDVTKEDYKDLFERLKEYGTDN